MSLRNLMNQRKSALRISHPFARYDHKNQLHCTLCQPSLIKNEQLWSSHLNSKGHRGRAAVYAQEQQEKAAQEAERAAQAAAESELEVQTSKKRAAEEEESELEVEATASVSKKQRLEAQEASTIPQAAEPEVEADPEWDALEQAILAEPSASTSAAAVSGNVISAAPKLIDPEGSEEDAEPAEGVAPQDEEEQEPIETEEERRERENKEELMQRIDDEEREQQEADQRVTALKARLAAMRSRRKP